MIREEFRLIRITTNQHESTRIDTNNRKNHGCHGCHGCHGWTRMFGIRKHECFGNRELPRWSLFQLGDLKGQLRNRCLQNIPDESQIDSRIIVHDAVAQTGYLQPWNRRVSLLEFGGKLLCCFAASPIISRLRTTASVVFSSARNEPSSNPAV